MARGINVAEGVNSGIYVLVIVAASIGKQFSRQVTRVGLSLNCLTSDLITKDERRSGEEQKK